MIRIMDHHTLLNRTRYPFLVGFTIDAHDRAHKIHDGCPRRLSGPPRIAIAKGQDPHRGTIRKNASNFVVVHHPWRQLRHRGSLRVLVQQVEMFVPMNHVLVIGQEPIKLDSPCLTVSLMKNDFKTRRFTFGTMTLGENKGLFGVLPFHLAMA